MITPDGARPARTGAGGRSAGQIPGQIPGRASGASSRDRGGGRAPAGPRPAGRYARTPARTNPAGRAGFGSPAACEARGAPSSPACDPSQLPAGGRAAPVARPRRVRSTHKTRTFGSLRARPGHVSDPDRTRRTRAASGVGTGRSGPAAGPVRPGRLRAAGMWALRPGSDFAGPGILLMDGCTHGIGTRCKS